MVQHNLNLSFSGYQYSEIQTVMISDETVTPCEVTVTTSEETPRSKNQHKTFKCNICLYSTKYKSDLKKHSSVHSGERLFKCEVCHQSFSMPHQLRRHSVIHTRKKPYSCDLCNMSFRQSINLKIHKNKHLECYSLNGQIL